MPFASCDRGRDERFVEWASTPRPLVSLGSVLVSVDRAPSSSGEGAMSASPSVSAEVEVVARSEGAPAGLVPFALAPFLPRLVPFRPLCAVVA